MKLVFGSKEKGAKIQFTETWGYRVTDYINTKDGRPTSTIYTTLQDAQAKYSEILNTKK